MLQSLRLACPIPRPRARRRPPAHSLPWCASASGQADPRRLPPCSTPYRRCAARSTPQGSTRRHRRTRAASAWCLRSRSNAPHRRGSTRPSCQDPGRSRSAPTGRRLASTTSRLPGSSTRPTVHVCAYMRTCVRACVCVCVCVCVYIERSVARYVDVSKTLEAMTYQLIFRTTIVRGRTAALQS